ncbi:hypothetical protein [Aeromonas allosaccharophila]
MFSIKSMHCKECSHHFQGYVKGLFAVMNEYKANCPECGKQVTIYGNGAFIDSGIPTDAVALEH